VLSEASGRLGSWTRPHPRGREAINGPCNYPFSLRQRCSGLWGRASEWSDRLPQLARHHVSSFVGSAEAEDPAAPEWFLKDTAESSAMRS
jgi:hypothetical protein